MIMNKIKQLREKNELTQETLADKLGYSRSLITKWETGAVKPTAGQMLDICNIFKVPLQFLSDEDTKIDALNKKYRDLNKTKRKFLISALTEDMVYLLGCMAMGIAMFYYPSDGLLISFIVFFATGVLGLAVIPYMLVKNARDRDSANEMKRWVVRSNVSKEEFKSITDIDSAFNKIILKK